MTNFYNLLDLLSVAFVILSCFQEGTNPKPRRVLKSKKYVQAAIGDGYTLARDSDGLVYIWGKENQRDFKEPTRIPIPDNKKIASISAGPRHAALIDVDGLIYTWGHGGNWFQGGGKLGHGNCDSIASPKLVERFKSFGVKAVDITCAQDHTVILTKDGEVLTCGIGEYGRLGTGKNGDSLVPVPIDTLADQNISAIAAGETHSLALSDKGVLYSWGRNDRGQLGHSDSNIDLYSMEPYPRAVDLQGNSAKLIAAGIARSACITTSGDLFVWGHRLGHVPLHIDKKLYAGLSIKKLVCGGQTSRNIVAFLAEDGSLWRLGTSKSGLLGESQEEGPEKMKLSHIKNPSVLDVFAGYGQHMAATIEFEL